MRIPPTQRHGCAQVSIHVVGSGPWVARTSGGPSRDVARFLAQARHILRPVRWKKHLCLHSCLCLAIGPPRVSSDGRRAARHYIMLQPSSKNLTACAARPVTSTWNIRQPGTTKECHQNTATTLSTNLHSRTLHGRVGTGLPAWCSVISNMRNLASGWRPKGWHQTCRGCTEPQ